MPAMIARPGGWNQLSRSHRAATFPDQIGPSQFDREIMDGPHVMIGSWSARC
jgi:hypothetical protein